MMTGMACSAVCWSRIVNFHGTSCGQFPDFHLLKIMNGLTQNKCLNFHPAKAINNSPNSKMDDHAINERVD